MQVCVGPASYGGFSIIAYNNGKMALGLQQVEAIDLSQRTKWYALVRLIFLLAIAAPGLLSIYVFQGWNYAAQNAAIISAVAILSNLVFYALIRFHKNPTYHAFLAMVWIVFDILLITVFIFTNGGIESRSPILYTVPVLIAAALFGRQGIYMSSLTSTVLYVGLIIADYFNVIQSMGAYDPTLRSNLAYVVNTICFFPAVFLVIALAIDFITGLLSEKQRQLRESIDALERAQETAKLGSWEWDMKHDEVAWSKELFRIYEMEPDNHHLDYEGYLKLIHPDDVAAHIKIIQTGIKKKTSFKHDHRIVLADGTIKYMHGEGRPEFDRDGNVIKLLGTAQDITEIYHLDIAKREFVSLASHQLRTPASGVKAFLSILIDGHAGALNKKQVAFAKKAYASNNRQLDIIESLLSLASIESGRLTMFKETIDLSAFVKQCLTAHRHTIRDKKHKLTYVKPKTPVMVTVDPNALQMAVDNLVSNAAKYTLDGGHITAEIRSTKSHAYLEITDTGIGIAKKDLPALFQKFSRISDPASKTVGGSGLGLYMAKYIVELHKGTLTVRSKYGVGTQFIIKLPLASKKK